MGPEDLKQTLCNLTPSSDDILVGFDSSDDACVYKVDDNTALVQTLDFITPVVDDPFVYGKIAAANSLSDVFAMGGEVKTALNIVGFDKKNHGKEVLKEILDGGNEKIKECQGLLLGGHTIEAPEMFYGLSVTGFVHPSKIYKNNTPKVGHTLVLTKPLGMGVLTTAIKRDLLNTSTQNEAVKVMEALNFLPSKLLRKFEVSSCTDITGFGLLGHSLECTGGNVTFSIHSLEVPYIKEAYDLAKDGVFPGGTKKNMTYLKDKTHIKVADELYYTLCCDAQTSGGLLVAMDENDAKEYIKQVNEYSFGYASIIGEVLSKQDRPLVLL